MLELAKQFLDKDDLLSGNFGIEREGLRVDTKGVISFNNHPEVFGDKINNMYITTDFSESQVEVITPPLQTMEQAYDFLNNLYNIVSLEIGDEFLWPQSMPCILPEDREIPIATYDESDKGKKSREYREKLDEKYGRKKQVISGIHINFSLNESTLRKLYENSNQNISFNEFKNNVYLKITRNYIRYRWALVYLLGATGVIHESFKTDCMSKNIEISDKAYSCNNIISFRNGECGYNNKIELHPNYNSIEEYVDSIKGFIKEGLIQSHKELYSSVRLKAKDNENLLESLINDGILYLEYRSVDINPFDKCGVSLNDLKFIQLFNLFLLFKDEEEYDNWQEEAFINHKAISKNGQLNIQLSYNGKKITREEWLGSILDDISEVNNIFDLGMDKIIYEMEKRNLDSKETYTYRMIELVKEKGYINANLDLAKEYKKEAYNNRFKLIGYENMELSTQILMKEAIKRGIAVDVVDRNDNFISLKAKGKIEYVKQATKTSKDNYITVLMMENKVVTKNVLDDYGVRVPKGVEFYSEESAIKKANSFVNKSIVIKPKSTNFGIGISIFKDGASEGDIIKALNIAFKYDNTVVVEEFIEGKEYRFLVIGDEVVGILHRVPANVVGDGVRTIEELVYEKNLNPLRGKGYKTPLEKISLDDNVKLFLKQSNKNILYIPKKDEVVYLRENSNISTGGDSVDYTNDIPRRFKDIAIKSAKAVGANICGVDMMISDYKNLESDYGIIELNFNPAIHIHSYPFIGEEREIAVKVLELLELV